MPRMRILNQAEKDRFETPPVFDRSQRKDNFDIPLPLLEKARTFRQDYYQVGFLLNCGYFKAAKRFFSPTDFHQRDIDYVIYRYELQTEKFSPDLYPDRTRQRHEQLILEHYGFNRFDSKTEKVILPEIKTMCRSHLKPKLIFGRCLDLLIQNHVQLPGANQLTELIRTCLNERKHELAELIDQNLSNSARDLLNELFDQQPTRDDEMSANARYKLTLLKKISQSKKPTKVKERIADLQLLEELYGQVKPTLSLLNLGHEGIRYYSGSVIKSEIFQLTRRKDEDRYTHLTAFIADQYYKMHDNLIDVLLSVVKTFQNSTQREHKELCYEQRKSQRAGLKELLSTLETDVFSMLKKIRNITQDKQSSDAFKVQEIISLLAAKKQDELDNLKKGFESQFDEIDYHDVIESRSLRLQNRVSPVVKALEFQAEPAATNLLKAITYFKIKDGTVTVSAPLDFLSDQERKAVTGENGRDFRVSLYKVYLFMHIASAIKSGNLNLRHSYKHRPLGDYLISSQRWDQEKEYLLERAGLTDFTNPKEILSILKNELLKQYQKTNQNISNGNNPHLKTFSNGSFSIRTPAAEESDNESLKHIFPERHYVPLTEVLSTVDQHCNFLGELQHWQQSNVKKVVPKRAQFASIMGLGCGIGTRKMAQISTQVTENELEHAVNWYFSLDNVIATNDRVVQHMDKMDLPNIYRKSQNELHTSSDGQKFEVRTESLNASYSFKYFGKSQGVSAYTFIDERNLLWYSTVFSAAERESAYVIDGLMHNDVVKSNIHSTDTHGYSEAIFGTTHLLGFSYAPRIKNLKKQQLYIFKSKNKSKSKDWKITPDNYVNEKVIIDNWDDFLRLIATIKLKESTASDIFRRLNSYSKQHTLYKAMKAFGQIIKSLFILRYLDEVELRQAIEKQLNKVELANRFTRAVAVGDPRGFTQAEKEDQNIAESCNRLIKNCIICWNYLFLSKKLSGIKLEQEKENLLKTITTHSVIAWEHINLLGVYDFSDDKLRDSFDIMPGKQTVSVA